MPALSAALPTCRYRYTTHAVGLGLAPPLHVQTVQRQGAVRYSHSSCSLPGPRARIGAVAARELLGRHGAVHIRHVARQLASFAAMIAMVLACAGSPTRLRVSPGSPFTSKRHGCAGAGSHRAQWAPSAETHTHSTAWVPFQPRALVSL
jgi:hypothetical protein